MYAGARDPTAVTLRDVTPIRLDVTNDEHVAAAAGRLRDVTLLINNAGIANFGGFLAEGSLESARAQLQTNYFGPLRMSVAFAPVLAANGGGAILNVLSIASWTSSPLLAIYASTKSAAWSLTNGLRHELREQGTQVLGMHMGFVDTDLTRDVDLAKVAPEAVVREAFDALERGAEEVLADDITRKVKPGLSAQPPVYLQLLQR